MIWGPISPARGERGQSRWKPGRLLMLVVVCVLVVVLVFYLFCRVEQQQAPNPMVTLCTHIMARFGTIMPPQPPSTADTPSVYDSVSVVIGIGWGVALSLRLRI